VERLRRGRRPRRRLHRLKQHRRKRRHRLRPPLHRRRVKPSGGRARAGLVVPAVVLVVREGRRRVLVGRHLQEHPQRREPLSSRLPPPPRLHLQRLRPVA
jgi:hypothetical protein